MGTLSAVHTFETREAMADAAAQVAQLVEGPYAAAAESRPDHVRLRREGEGPEPDEIHFIAYTEARGGMEGLCDAMGRDEIDVSISIPPVMATAIPNVDVRVEAGRSTALLFINADRPRLTSPEVRQGVASALDRRDICVAAFGRDDLLATTLLPPSMWTDAPRPPSPPRGNAGPLRGQRLSLVIPWAPRSYLASHWAAAESVAEQLAMLGVLVDIEPTDAPVNALERAQAGDYDLFLAGWSADNDEVSDFYRAILHSRSIPGHGHEVAVSCNLGRLRSDAVDQQLAGEGVRDDAAKEALERAAAESATVAPLCHGPTVVVTGPRVVAIGLLPGNTLDLMGVTLA